MDSWHQNEKRAVLRGANVAYVDFGGPEKPEALCVLVHGLGGASVNWAALTPLLTSRFRCVALDLVGFGMTEPGDRGANVRHNTGLLTAFVKMITQDYPGLPLLLVGNSMGGLITARYAAKRPAPPVPVAGLVLLDPALPAPGLVPGMFGVLAAGLLAVPAVGRGAARARRSLRTPEQNVNDTLRWCTADPSRIDPDVVAAHLPLAHRRQFHPEMDRYYGAAARSTLTTVALRQATDAMYARVKAPVLLIHGTRDRLVSFSGAVRMARRNPSWRFAPASDSGHLPMLEHPGWTAAQLFAWWDSVVVADGELAHDDVADDGVLDD